MRRRHFPKLKISNPLVPLNVSPSKSLTFYDKVVHFLKLKRMARYLGKSVSSQVLHVGIGAHPCFHGTDARIAGTDEMPVRGRVNPSIEFSDTHLYTWVERNITRVW